MAITSMLNFDHLPAGVFTGGPSGGQLAGCGLELIEHPFALIAMSGSRALVITQDGWLTKNIDNISTPYAAFGIVKENICSPAASSFGIGFKVKSDAGVTANSILLAAYANTSGSTVITLFTQADIPTGDTEAFFEVKVTVNAARTTLTFERWVNGSKILDVTNSTSTVVAGWDNGTLHLRHNTRTGSALRTYYKDFYSWDSTGDDQQVKGPLGPIRVLPIVVDQVSGEGWTPSGSATLKDALTTAWPAAGSSTPLDSVSARNTGQSPGPLQLTFSNDTIDSQIIHAVEIRPSAKAAQAVFMELEGVVKSGGSSVPITKRTIPTSPMQLGYRTGIMERAPNGEAWSKESLDALSLDLTVKY